MNIQEKVVTPYGTKVPSAPYVFKAYPTMLFGEDGSTVIANDPDHKQKLLGEGWMETPPPPRPSQVVQLTNQPQNVRELGALGEQAARFDTKYRELYDQFTQLGIANEKLQSEYDSLAAELEQKRNEYHELVADHSTLARAHADLQKEHSALMDSATKPSEKSEPEIKFQAL